jgi:hypothetical protein
LVPFTPSFPPAQETRWCPEYYRAEVRIPRKAIEVMEPGKVSIMPQGLDAQLSRQELGDLIAFLLSLK